MTFELWSAILAAFFCVTLGAFAYIKNPSNASCKSFALLNLSLAAWIPTDFIRYITDHQTALTIYRLCYIGGSFIAFTLLMFMWSIVEHKSSRMYSLTKWSAISFAVLSQTRWVIKDIQTNVGLDNPIVEIHGPLYAGFMLYFVLAFVFAMAPAISSYRKALGVKRNQLQYIALSLFLGFIALINFFANQISNKIPPLFYILIIGISTTFAVAIMKHHLMDINVVIRKTFIYSLVTAGLAAVYVGTITLLAHVLGSRHGSVSAFSSALAAVFITLLFNPLRIHIQRWVDRQFPREKLDPALLQEAAGGFAHEMKRPLSKIAIPAELALMDLQLVKSGEKSFEETFPSLNERLRFIISQSADAGYMIEAVRELSAASAAPFEPVDLAIVIKTALAAENDLLERRGVTSTLSLPENLPSVSGRAKQLEIVFVNLIKNAAEAMGDLPHGQPRELTIEGENNGAGVIISVRDTGPGIKPEDIAKVFQPHYSTKGARGTGIGLYLSQQIVQTHNGTLEVASQNGKGTVFILKLPTKGKQA